MNNKQQQNEETKKWKEELLQDGRTEQEGSPFTEVAQGRGSERSAEEEADAEQQYKEALTERD